jgi:signal transduction histidine kinase
LEFESLFEFSDAIFINLWRMDSTEEVKFIFWTGTLAMLFLAAVLILLVVFYQRHLAKIKQQETELLLKSTLAAEKKERQRIAKDLHDGVQSDLNAIKNYVVYLSNHLNTSKTQDLIETIIESLKQTSENTRLISYKLMPPLLETSGFEGAISHYFERLSKTSGKSFQCNFSMEHSSLTEETAYDLFRIVQELTTNMLKYGNVQVCSLEMKADAYGWTLTLTDDGVPFDFKENYALSKGAGLHNIQSRLNAMHATLTQMPLQQGNQYLIHFKLKK